MMYTDKMDASTKLLNLQFGTFSLILSHNSKIYTGIIESVDSISRDELDVPLTQYITNT